MVYVDQNVISSAAQLIFDGLDALPAADEAEWKGFDREETEALHAVLDEVEWVDLCVAVERAANRVNARTDDEPDGNAGGES